MEPPDISREVVLTIFRDAQNAELRKHRGTVGTDGQGNFRVMCECPIGGLPINDWFAHTKEAAASARKVPAR